jgi:hypothetical protein
MSNQIDLVALVAQAGAGLLHAHPEGQSSRRGVARVCALGQTAHTRYGDIKPRSRGGRGCRVGEKTTPQTCKVSGTGWVD